MFETVLSETVFGPSPKKHKHNECRQKPPLPDPHFKRHLTSQILYVVASLAFEVRKKAKQEFRRVICGLRVGARRLELSGETRPLRGLWMAHLLSPLPWKTDTPLRGPWRASRGPESLSRALFRASGKGFPRPRTTETRGQVPRPLRGPKTSGPLSRVYPSCSAPSGRNWKGGLLEARPKSIYAEPLRVLYL